MRRQSFPGIVVCLTLALGCSDTTTGGGGGGGDGGSSGNTIALEALPAAYYGALCGALYRCPTLPEGGTALAIFRNEATCVQRAGSLAGANLDDLVTAVRAGRVRYDGAVAARCLQEVTARCAQSDAELARICRGAFTGTLAVGAGCWRSEECTEGYCDHETGSARQCPGVCRPSVAAGGACSVARQCAGWGDGSGACLGGTCVAVSPGAPAAAGGACGLVQAGASAIAVECMAGSVCVNNRCEAVVAADAPCMRGQPCATGHVCVERPGTTTTVCTLAASLVVNQPGATCAAMGTPLCNPLERLRCEVSSRTCVSVGDGTMGSNCLPGSDFLSLTCNSGLRCDDATRRCVARLAVGAMCQRDSDCLSGECTEGRCLERICQ